MDPLRTVDDVIRQLGPSPAGFAPIPAPVYDRERGNSSGIGLAVESMRRHTTDEGFQLFIGLESAGYYLHGYGFPDKQTDVASIVAGCSPGAVVLQDKREWLGLTAGGPRRFDNRETFTNVEALAKRLDIFKLTILKDSHNKPEFHRQSAKEIGCHAWVVYYHPRIVSHLAPYVRLEHLVRTYHSLDSEIVPPFRGGKLGCVLSGSVSNAYPLRMRLFAECAEIPSCKVIRHPGYHAKGCDTPQYLYKLSKFKVAICTSSRFGYALRKIVEAIACGCTVVTDLPSDEVLPHIDTGLVRVPSTISTKELATVVSNLYETWDPDRAYYLSKLAKQWYDYRAVGKRLVDDIEKLRMSYPSAVQGV